MCKILFSRAITRMATLLVLLHTGSSRAQVGVNTTNPQSTFHVDGAGDNNASGVPSATQQLNDVFVLSSGNVGVGILAPTAKLEVDGQVRIRGGNPGATRLLVSDATGLASWQNRMWLAAIYNMSATISGPLTGGTTVLRGAGGAVTGTSITVPERAWYRISASFYLCYNASAPSGFSRAIFTLQRNGANIISVPKIFDNEVVPAEGCTTFANSFFLQLSANDVLTWTRTFDGATISNALIEVQFIKPF